MLEIQREKDSYLERIEQLEKRNFICSKQIYTLQVSCSVKGAKLKMSRDIIKKQETDKIIRELYIARMDIIIE